MRELALFAGAGGGILGGQLLGWRTVCAVEIDTFCRSVLLARQRDRMLPRFPIWDDVRTFNGYQWHGAVDVVSGGFPCQDISSAGKRAGITGTSSGLWFEMLRIISEVRPVFVFAENSPHLRTRGLGTCIAGLAGLGYDSRWCVLGDCHAGGATIGARLWLVAKANSCGEREQPIDVEVGSAQEFSLLGSTPYSVSLRVQQRRRSWESGEAKTKLGDNDRTASTGCAGTVDGLANRMDRIRATGNGQVPTLAALAWSVLTQT